MAICLDRVLGKLDEYFARNDMSAAGRHLDYWYQEALAEGNRHAQFTLLNELIGFHRKQGNRAQALEYSGKIIALCKEMELEDTVSGATAFINAATACKAFGHAREALPLFRKAKEIYEARLEMEDPRLAALYNNMALAFSDAGELDEAKQLLGKALMLTVNVEERKPDAAVTCLNMADVAEQEKGYAAAETEISELLQRARNLLDSRKDSKDSYYAFVCEKCAPAFRYYGDAAYAEELKERSEKIYEGT